MMNDNVHNLRPAFIEDFASSITPADVKARIGGEYAAGEDLVFANLEIPISKVPRKLT